MRDPHISIRRVMETLPGVNAGAAAEAVEERLRQDGFTIAYVSKCWCEGKANGPDHSPGCPELAREVRAAQNQRKSGKRRGGPGFTPMFKDSEGYPIP